MRVKRVSCLFLAALLIAASCLIPAGAFKSEPALWAAKQMSELEQAGLYQGLSSQEIAPSEAITRGQFCKMMVNLIETYGLPERLDGVSPESADFFADLSYSVKKDSIGGLYDMYYAAAYGLTAGTTRADGTRIADAYGKLTREQAAAMMCYLTDALERYAGISGEAQGQPRTFKDGNTISGWAKDYVDRASSLSILVGDDLGNFNPKKTLSWQEASVMLYRSYEEAKQAGQGGGGTVPQSGDVYKTALDVNKDKFVGQSTPLYLLKDGSVLMLKGANYAEGSVQVESYDANRVSSGVRTIPMELDFCAAFYEGENHYYLAFGQENMEENNNKEVYRVVKYDKRWNRLGAASVTGGQSYTTTPYRSTSHVGMVEEDGTLVLHTSRLRYLTSDGLRHQSNITIKINTDNMAVTGVSSQFPSNHVSHSFAQYVAFDGGLPVYADHGDGYPRAFALNVEDAQGQSSEHIVFPFYGAIGDNTTNAIPGGLGIAADNYLFAGASSPQKGNDSLKYCNAFLAVTSKDSGKSDIKWLTSLPADGKEYVSAVKLVQLNNNTFVVMWQTEKVVSGLSFHEFGDFRYAVFDGTGNQIGQTKTVEGYLAPVTDPTVEGGKISWVRPEKGDLTTGSVTKSTYLRRYTLDIDLNSPSSQSDVSLTMSPKTFTMTVGQRESVKLSASGGGITSTPAVTYQSSDWRIANVEKDGTVTANKEGTATITASFTWRSRKYSAVCEITVSPAPPASLTLADKAVSLAVGETAALKPTVTNATPAPTVYYTSSNRTVASVDSSGTVKALKAGTATITASIYWQGKSYTDTCTVTVAPQEGVSMSMDTSSLSLTAGQRGSVKATVTGASYTPSISYTSGNRNVATVDSRGNVTAVGAGTTTITASCTVNGQSYTASCNVTVTAAQEGVSVTMDPSLSLTAGQRGSVKATVTGASYTPSISYTSGNRNVATVDSRGNVTAVGAGTTTITASCTVNGQSYTASCNVTVTAAQEDISMSMDTSSLSLTAGQGGSVKATVTGASYTPSISYTSGNRNVATVDSRGNVTAVGAGTTTITASCTVNGQSYTVSCNVTVTAADTGAGTGTGTGTGTGSGTEQQETPFFHTPRHIYVAGTSAPRLYVYRNGREVDITSEATWRSESSLLKLTMSGGMPTVQLTAPGTGYITATWKGQTLRKEYQIVDSSKYVYLTGAYSGLYPGRTFSTSLCIYKSSISASECEVEWSVDRPDVVELTEDNSGSKPGVVIKAKSPGRACITCRVTLPDGTRSEALCYITVYPD